MFVYIGSNLLIYEFESWITDVYSLHVMLVKNLLAVYMLEGIVVRKFCCCL